MNVSLRPLGCAVALALLATLAPTSAALGDRRDPVRSLAVAFHVSNTNRTAVACTSDDREYAVHARLVGRSSELAADTIPRLNVLIHDITVGGWFWHLRRHPTYDYATQLARNGEVSLVIDRLGYDRSPLADGTATCLGAQADMLHQVVDAVRAGGTGSGETVPEPETVVLHGHSVGAAVAELEAATFGDVDGLVLMSWTDSGATSRAIQESAAQHQACVGGGDPDKPGYAAYGQDARAFRQLLFATAKRAVQHRATWLRNLDPCGDATSLAQLVASLNAVTHAIAVPVLLLFAGEDALNRADAREAQTRAYGPTAAVTSRVVPGAGSALPLEESAPRTRRWTLRWLAGLPPRG